MSFASAYTQENLVSSRPEDGALLTDPSFINAWGLAIRPAGAGGHWWITNTDTSRVTLYVGDSPTVPFTQDGLSVLGVPGAPGETITIPIDPPTLGDGTPLPGADPTPATEMPPSNPTGQVFNGSNTEFLVSGTSLTGAPIDAFTRFIVCSEDGTIAAWGETGASPAQRMDRFEVVIDNSTPDENGIVANYKGLTTSAETGSDLLLYVANFSQNRIDVFDGAWQPVEGIVFAPVAPGGRDIADYAPFNIERVFDPSLGRDVLIVAYARVADAAGGEEAPTDGFIAKFGIDGTFLDASDADGQFNAPWGVAMAPADGFGSLGGDLLVGNFGDGRILSLDIATLDFEGFLLAGDGTPVVIDGLWDLIVGNGASLGAADRLYFAAGPEEETAGLFGSLSFAGDAAMTLAGTLAEETLTGGTGADSLHGHRGADALEGAAGADTARGGQGDDTVSGAAGDDLLGGGEGDDSLDGGTGADNLVGREGDDVLLGGEGTDTLRAGEGADTLLGGSGGDVLRGHTGADAFRYLAASEGGDTIARFVTGEDRLEISAAGFGGGLAAGGTLGADRFVLGGAATEAVGQVLYDGAAGRIWWDEDGTGDAAATLLATIRHAPAIAADDILVIG